MSDISTAIQQLVNYGLDTGLILPDDEIYIRNQLLMTMQLDSFTAPEGEVCYTDLESILKTLLDDAVARARNVAAPANAQRFGLKTPCGLTGQCGDCTSPDCICSKLVITRFCMPAGRIKVILVGEDLGL